MSKISHLAIILDGNGRWATEQNLPRSEGHKEGAKKILHLLDKIVKTDIKYLTLYALSSDNFKRNKIEVNKIINTIEEYVKYSILPFALLKNIRLSFIGARERLPLSLISVIEEVSKKTKDNNYLNLVIALDYGGRDEVVKAVNALLMQKTEKNISYSDIEKYLYTAMMPDPDVILRYGKRKRLSDFMPLQSVYSELMFLDKYWPDFKNEDIDRLIEDYKGIQRNYGELNEE